MQANPYEILGVKETDSLEHIDKVYQGFMKILHPDKANTKEAEVASKNAQLDEKIKEANNLIKSNQGLQGNLKKQEEISKLYREL